MSSNAGLGRQIVNALGGMLILSLGPVLILVGLWGYVQMHNARLSSGVIGLNLDYPLLPDEGTAPALAVTLRLSPPGTPSEAAPAPPALDVAILVDVSGSMTDALPDLAQHIDRLSRQMLAPGQSMRLAIMRFDTRTSLDLDWTGDPADLDYALAPLKSGDGASMGGSNDLRDVFPAIRDLMTRARPGARRVGVFFTDGVLAACNSCPRLMDWPEIEETSGQLRQQGVQFFAVGLPGKLDRNMARITGSSAALLTPDSMTAIASSLRLAIGRASDFLADRGDLLLPLKVEMRDNDTVAPPWDPAPNGLRLVSTPLYASLVPESIRLGVPPAGLWAIGDQPASLTWIDQTGQQQKVQADGVPLLLVIPLWLWLLAFLPALLFVIIGLLRLRRPLPPPAALAPRVLRRPLPAPVLVPEPPEHPRPVQVPTLFIGLGGLGRLALARVRRDLSRGAGSGEAGPFRYLAFDLDRTEAADRDRDPAVLPPQSVRQLAESLLDQPDPDSPLAWFDPKPWQSSSRADLELNQGSRGERALARLALFRWLSEGSLLALLRSAVTDLLTLPRGNGPRRIVILAGEAGGFGSAVLLDFARIVGRLGRDMSGADGFSPDVVGLLLGEEADRLPDNTLALMQELETAQSGGRRPTRVSYVGDDPLLDRTDPVPPFHWVFRLCDPTPDGVAEHAAAACSLLADRQGSNGLLAMMPSLWTDPALPNTPDIRGPNRLQVRCLFADPMLLADLTRDNLVLRLIGRLAAPATSPAPAASDVTPAAELIRWRDGANSGTAWAALLAAAAEPDVGTGRLLDAFRQDGTDLPSWLVTALCSDLGRLLVKPGCDGPAVLTLLQARLSGPVLQTLATSGGEGWMLDGVRNLAVAVGQLVQSMAVWRADVDQVLSKLHDRMAERRRAARLPDGGTRISLNGTVDGPTQQRHLESVIQLWLQTADVATGLSTPELRYEARCDAAGPALVVQCNLGRRSQFDRCETLLAMLETECSRISRLQPVPRLDSALSLLTESDRKSLARRIPGDLPNPTGEMLATPAGNRMLSDFADSIPPVVGGRFCRRVAVSGASALWHVIWGGEGQHVHADSRLPLVQATDCVAEQWRRKTAWTLRQSSVPPLPLGLRQALASPSLLLDFARALFDGRIVQRNDDHGRAQWFRTADDRFLTADEASGLADAAWTAATIPVPPSPGLQSPGLQSPGPLSTEGVGSVRSLNTPLSDADRLVVQVLECFLGEQP
jgi:hypothetical protein